jgi:pantothenate synthetase
MEDRDTIEGERLLALAVFVGKTRLIDNCIIEA